MQNQITNDVPSRNLKIGAQVYLSEKEYASVVKQSRRERLSVSKFIYKAVAIYFKSLEGQNGKS